MSKDFDLQNQATSARTNAPLPDEVLQLLEQVVPGAALTVSGKAVRLGAVEITPVGLRIDTAIDQAEWQRLGEMIEMFSSATQWMYGDWFAYGDTRWGIDYEQVRERTSLAKQTLYDYTYVAKNVQFSLRNENLSFWHHRLVASLSPEKQQYWLEAASREGWSVARLRNELGETPSLTQVQRFEQQFWRFRDRALKITRRLQWEGRANFAAELRKLADEIERNEG